MTVSSVCIAYAIEKYGINDNTDSIHYYLSYYYYVELL